MNYYENLQAAGIIFAVVLFVMSWDFVPPVLRKVFGK